LLFGRNIFTRLVVFGHLGTPVAAETKEMKQGLRGGETRRSQQSELEFKSKGFRRGVHGVRQESCQREERMKAEGKAVLPLLHPSAFILHPCLPARVNCSAGFIAPLHNAATAAARSLRTPGVRAVPGGSRAGSGAAGNTRNSRRRAPFPFSVNDIGQRQA
jgi:hypothetical protein